MTNTERMKETFKTVKKGSRFKTKEIKDLVIKTFPNDHFSRDSILPSDHSYDLYNVGLIEDVENQYIIFKQINHGYYEYIGENAKISCDIIHKPKKGSPYIIGEWKDGTRIIYKWY